MAEAVRIPIGIRLTTDIEVLTRARSGNPFRARVRWTDRATGNRPSKSETFESRELAQDWLDRLVRLSARDIDPMRACVTLTQYGTDNMDLALRGLEGKTKDPYLSGWRKRVVPTMGHLWVPSITNGICDRAVAQWIEEQGCGKSTIKNTLSNA